MAQLESFHDYTRDRGQNRVVYWVARTLLMVVCKVWFRMSHVGYEHVPASGPVIVASNHRSFLDPFVIGLGMRRPIYYMAKRELFRNRLVAWFLNCVGAFPVDRGQGDQAAMATARMLLERGESVLVFPEGTRTRPGSLGRPRRGIGRLALETGAPVVPVAVIGTEDVRRGWRIRPRKVRVRAGRPLTFPRVERPSVQLAGAVTDRIWPCIELQWEWLGGLPPLRRAAVIGAGAWGTAMAVMLARAGLRVDLGCRTREQALELSAARENARHLPGVALPEEVTVARAAELELSGHDLVVLAVPARALPAVVAAHAERIPQRAGVLVLAKGLVAPLGTLASAYVSERVRARSVACLGGPAHAAEAVAHGAAVVVASADGGFARQVADVLAAGGLAPERSSAVAGVELAGCAKNAAALAAATVAPSGPNVAGAAAGRVLGEIGAYAARCGVDRAPFAGLAGAGDLVATVLADGSRNRRAGELLAAGVPAPEIGERLGHAAEAVDTVPLLAGRLRSEGVPAPALDGLAALLDGRLDPAGWAEQVLAPPPRTRRAAA